MRALVLAALGVCGVAQEIDQGACTFWFPESGLQYDLSAIRANGPAGGSYKYQNGPSQVYMWSLCKDITNLVCLPGSVPTASALLTSDQSSCAQNYGEMQSVTASFAEGGAQSGIRITYSGGQPCGPYSNPSYTQFNVLCAKDASVNPVQYGSPPFDVSGDHCGVFYTIRSPAGCPTEKIRVVPALGGGWVTLIVLTCLALAYLVGGILYKRWKFGSSGMEAVPHIDLWRTLASHAMRILTCGKAGYQKADFEYYGHMAEAENPDSSYY